MSANRVKDSIPGGNHRSYIASRDFQYDFYSYNGRTLNNVTDDSTLCPAGRVLRENGKKLFPNANPGINQYYVGVYDPITFLKGFIDPNGGIFAEFNTNKPNYLDDNYSDDGSDDNSQGGDAGDPVYTKGDVSAVSWNGPDSNNNNYIQLVNDVSGGNWAYAGCDNNANEPYLECYSTNGGDHSQAYIQTKPNEAQLELNGNGIGFVGAYASDGSIYNSGVIHPYNTCGVATLVAGVTTVQVPATSGPVAILSRKTFNTYAGTLTWDVSGTTLTIYSSDNRDTGQIGWLLLSSTD